MRAFTRHRYIRQATNEKRKAETNIASAPVTSLGIPRRECLWFCQIYFYFLFFRRQGFRMIIFDRQAGPFQHFNRSQVMVIGRSVSFSDPARPPGGCVGRPKHPKIPPPPNFGVCVSDPQEHF